MNQREINIHPGQRVITTAGTIVVVAYVRNGNVWAYWNGDIVLVHVVADAWGGEHDQTIGIAA
jgi:hypothetical protein